MSDERDETRPVTPSGDATRAGGTPAADDATRVGGLPAADDATRVGGFPADDRLSARRDEPTVLRPRPDATSVMPPVDDDWAPSRANPAWSGRAAGRAPQPGRTVYTETEEWPATVGREPRDRWWMPILVGFIALVLLAALAFGIYLIVQNTGGGDAPAPVIPTTVATTEAPTAPPTTEPSSEPTTPSPTPSTSEPATTEITVPALVGRSLTEAEAALTTMNLNWRVLYLDNKALPGTVIDSDPAEGQEVPPDTRITLVVAGPDPSATPSTSAPAGGTGLDDD
jgi:hypothetical protein